jgi:uncharacterized protein YbjT (DUF2867 family)
MLLVTGATGTIGRPLVDILVNEGVKVRAVTHGPQAANLPAEVEVVQGDLARPAAIAPFLGGVTGLFLHPRAVGQAAGELLRLARQRGVRRVVALSAMNVDDPLDQQPSRYHGDRNKEVEDATVQSGLEWVSLRASSFAANTLRASLTHRQLVATIGEVLGRPLRYHELPPEAATQGMLAQGLPEPFVRALMARYARGVGQIAPVTGEVERILGRPARAYARWVADHAAAFRNQQPAGSNR